MPRPMTITEAKRVVINMAAQYKALTVIADALIVLETGEKTIESLSKQKAEAESEMIGIQVELNKEKKRISDEMEVVKRNHAESKAVLTGEIEGLAGRVQTLNKNLADTTNSIQSETNRLLAERKVKVNEIESLIKNRSNNLIEINQEINRVRTKIME